MSKNPTQGYELCKAVALPVIEEQSSCLVKWQLFVLFLEREEQEPEASAPSWQLYGDCQTL